MSSAEEDTDEEADVATDAGSAGEELDDSAEVCPVPSIAHSLCPIHILTHCAHWCGHSLGSGS